MDTIIIRNNKFIVEVGGERLVVRPEPQKDTFNRAQSKCIHRYI